MVSSKALGYGQGFYRMSSDGKCLRKVFGALFPDFLFPNGVVEPRKNYIRALAQGPKLLFQNGFS